MVSERVAGTGGSLILTDEQRKQRSDRARAMVKDGRFGGVQPRSGRPSKLKTKLAVQVAGQIAAMDTTGLSLASSVLAMVGMLSDDDADVILDAVLRAGRR